MSKKPSSKTPLLSWYFATNIVTSALHWKRATNRTKTVLANELWANVIKTGTLPPNLPSTADSDVISVLCRRFQTVALDVAASSPSVWGPLVWAKLSIPEDETLSRHTLQAMLTCITQSKGDEHTLWDLITYIGRGCTNPLLSTALKPTVEAILSSTPSDALLSHYIRASGLHLETFPAENREVIHHIGEILSRSHSEEVFLAAAEVLCSILGSEVVDPEVVFNVVPLEKLKSMVKTTMPLPQKTKSLNILNKAAHPQKKVVAPVPLAALETDVDRHVITKSKFQTNNRYSALFGDAQGSNNNNTDDKDEAAQQKQKAKARKQREKDHEVKATPTYQKKEYSKPVHDDSKVEKKSFTKEMIPAHGPVIKEAAPEKKPEPKEVQVVKLTGGGGILMSCLEEQLAKAKERKAQGDSQSRGGSKKVISYAAMARKEEQLQAPSPITVVSPPVPINKDISSLLKSVLPDATITLDKGEGQQTTVQRKVERPQAVAKKEEAKPSPPAVPRPQQTQPSQQVAVPPPKPVTAPPPVTSQQTAPAPAPNPNPFVPLPAAAQLPPPVPPRNPVFVPPQLVDQQSAFRPQPSAFAPPVQRAPESAGGFSVLPPQQQQYQQPPQPNIQVRQDLFHTFASPSAFGQQQSFTPSAFGNNRQQPQQQQPQQQQHSNVYGGGVGMGGAYAGASWAVPQQQQQQGYHHAGHHHQQQQQYGAFSHEKPSSNYFMPQQYDQHLQFGGNTSNQGSGFGVQQGQGGQHQQGAHNNSGMFVPHGGAGNYGNQGQGGQLNFGTPYW